MLQNRGRDDELNRTRVEVLNVLKRIHVNQHIIRANRQNGDNSAPITVRTSKGLVRGHDVEIRGPSRVVYSPIRPLACGARLWIETYASVSAADLTTGTTVEIP
jgi:hypothetical protein